MTATVAYFSMEIGLEPGVPTYSGGLGVLAGDTLRSAADLAILMVGALNGSFFNTQRMVWQYLPNAYRA